eukprot:31529_1
MDNETDCGSNASELDKNKWLVFGYIRNTISSHIPSEIQLLIVSFFGKYFKYEGKYTWIIKGDLLEQIVSVKHQESFQSTQFEMAGLHWSLDSYPNGCDDMRKGCFLLFLKLLSEPYKGHRNTKVTIYRRMFCHETHSCYGRISTYRKNDDFGWAAGCLSFDEVKNSNLEQLTFTVEIRILQIVDIFNTILDEHDIYYNKPFIKQSFQWKIDDKLLQQMKLSNVGKRFESIIYNKMWFINITPNGATKKWEDAFDIFLVLCSLPKNVSKITAKWKISAHPQNIEMNGSKDFSFKKCFVGWCRKQIFSFKEFQKYDVMTVSVEIEIMNIFDKDGDKIDKQQWWMFTK